MQTTSAAFTNHANGQVRPISYSFLASFDKVFDPAVSFFEIGVSEIGGIDVIAPDGGNVVQEWDKYEYVDYSDRIVSVEWSRQEDPYSSVTLAHATITLNNYDNYFNNDSDSPISQFILPGRPIRLHAGFNGENVPVFVGLTEDAGQFDKKSGTVTFKAMDFLSFIFNQPLDRTVIYINQRSDQVMSELLQEVGLLPSQFDLDPGFTIIPFAYFERRTKLGTALVEIMEAEMGRFYMDELGIIRFKNRQNILTTPVWAFDSANVIDYGRVSDNTLINAVEVTGRIRKVQELQDVGTMALPTLIRAGQTVDVWIEFSDPVTTVDAPQPMPTPTTSYFVVNTQQDGFGTPNTADVVVDASQLFATSYLVTFENNGASDLWITEVKIYGTPARVVEEIDIREESPSFAIDPEERILSIDNDLFQDEDTAQSKALILLNDWSNYQAINSIDVKGNPALQIGDPVSFSVPGSLGVPLLVFEDAFNNSSLDPEWSTFGTITVTETTVLDIETATVAGYGGIISDTYDFNDSFATAELIDAGNQSLVSLEVYPLFVDCGSDNEFYFLVTNGLLLSVKVVANVPTTVDSIAYNPSVHRWFRIRETNNTVFWEVATNGVDFTVMHSEATPFSVASSDFLIFSGTYANEGVQVTTQFANFSLYEDTGGVQTYQITKQDNSIAGGRYSQRLYTRIFERTNYFTIGESAINGGDEIAP